VGRFFREAARVLRPGGTFLLVDTTVPMDIASARWINEVERLRDPSHVLAYPTRIWARQVELAGLHIEEHRLFPKRHPLEAWLARSGCEGGAADEVRRRMREAPSSIAGSIELDENGEPVAFTDWKLCLRASKPPA